MVSQSLLRNACGVATAAVFNQGNGEYKDATACVTSWLLTTSGWKEYTANTIVPMARHIRSAGIQPPQHILDDLATAVRLREESTREHQKLTSTTNLTRSERAKLECGNKSHTYFCEQLKTALNILRPRGPAVRVAVVVPAANHFDTFLGVARTTTPPSRDAWENPFQSGEGVVSRPNSNRSTLRS
jgi:hypothetical protein